ncbi:hypothetical protein RBH26_08390 [Natronolimnohabitans sp. A-GB9]|uniref:hypothetical protein n=1 Tax=Natronolimnohabitans sp. A-GB9 TaxID=3069757 RepID=UPI0027AEF3F4|nr:hypothetical protein [Natronolimnohabitans sp. A-GB9]MDQ2050505.1 hypothetical protein [Natronolimnohabitans sp. A-GB9]
MASSELPSSEHASRPLRLECVESIPAGTTTRHVDQLDTETLDTFYAALDGDRSLLEADTDLEIGEVIVFTEYYRVDHV